MDIAGRLERIEQEIRQAENEKLQREQMLSLFWEHMPAIDPILIRDRMLFLQNEIRSLENRKRSLRNEQQSLIVRAVTLGDRGD
jgi:pheromone shutdown protein TraB